MATQYTAGLSAGQILTAATMNQIGAAWETYTPTLTASTTNPNLGSTGTATGRWARIQKIVFGQANFTFNGAGIAAGLGFYFYSLPVTAQALGPVAGSAYAIDISAFATTHNTLYLDTTNRLVGIGTGGGVLAATIQHNTYVWAAGDQIKVNFCYEAA